MRALFCLTVLACLWCQAAAEAQSAGNKATPRLVELLQPANSYWAMPSAPKAWLPGTSVEKIDGPLRGADVKPPRLASAPRQNPRPNDAREGVALLDQRNLPVLPEVVQMPTQPLINLPAPEKVNALPVPILSLPTPDRASLQDPTPEFSVAAALKPVQPSRTAPIPFAPLNLPDPFEHARVGQVQNPPPERNQPPALPSAPPRK